MKKTINTTIKTVILFLLISKSNIADAQWKTANSPNPDSTWITALITNGTDIYASALGGVFYSSDNGNSWTVKNNGLLNLSVWCMAINGSNMAAGTDSGIYFSNNNGNNWAPSNNGLSTLFINAINITGSNVFAGTDKGVFLSTNNGTSWNSSNSGLPVNTSVSSIESLGNNIYLGTNKGVYVSNNNGGSWVASNNGLTNTDIQTLKKGGSNIYAGTYKGIFVSSDNGTTWSNIGSGSVLNSTINAINTNGNDVFISNDNDVFISSNNGASWTAVSNGLGSNTIYAFATLGTNAYCGGIFGGVYKRPLSEMTSSSTSIREKAMSRNNVYPNPSNGIININSNQEIANINVYDIAGTAIHNQSLTSKLYQTEIDLSSLNNGIYFITVQSSSGEMSKSKIALAK